MKLLRAVLPGFAVALLCGAAPAWAADVDFEPVPLGTTPDVQVIEFVNEGDEDVPLGVPEIVGADAASFSFEENYCINDVLRPGEACDVYIRFDPERIGLNEATLRIPVLETDDAVTATLAGEGRQSIRLTPRAIDFGTAPLVSMGLEPTREVLVENVSDEPIAYLQPGFKHLSSAFIFTASTCSGPTLGPGASCRLTLSFLGRQASGAYTDVLEIRKGWKLLATAPVTGTRVNGPPWFRRRPPPRPRTPEVTPSPSVSPTVRASLAGALERWRGLGRAGLRKRGFAITGFTAPVDGDAYLLVRSGKRVVASSVFFLRAGKPAKLRVRATRAGRRLLAGKRAMKLEVVLRFVAASDQRVSRAERSLRL